MKNNSKNLTVFFDYTCPWVRQAGHWLIAIEKKALVNIIWKPFLLEQQNSEFGENWNAWDQDLSKYISRGIWPHLGGIAARKLSKEAGYIYMESIFEEKHVNRKDIRSREFIVNLVKSIGIHSQNFEKEMDSDEALRLIAESHKEAASKGIFGTPTIEFNDGNAVFLKTFTPPQEDYVTFYESLKNITFNNSYFGELKKPQPPWPKQHSL